MRDEGQKSKIKNQKPNPKNLWESMTKTFFVLFAIFAVSVLRALRALRALRGSTLTQRRRGIWL